LPDGGAAVFGIVFAAVVLIALLSGVGEFIMRIRLTRAELPSEKLLWWRRGGDDVADAYRGLYPSSRIPLIREIVFKVLLGSAILLLIFALLKRG
jgi:hypothetical protein